MPLSRKIVGLVGAGGVCIGLVVWLGFQFVVSPEPDSKTRLRSKSPSVSENLVPLVRAKSPYLNTTEKARYLGNTVCRGCHEAQHRSYQQTGHSRALAKTRPPNEPSDVEFYHPASHKWYEVYRKDGKLRHREFVRDKQGREVELNDYPIAWTIGSGRFSKSYLVEDQGFLVESPITWYASRQKWALSPGFDKAAHAGFQRLADQGCLVCHAGRVEREGGNRFRPRVIQPAIGCESCHGPGSLHVERHESGTVLKAGQDDSIVNPARLERRLSESVCANCHLRGVATVFRRGLGLTDFRPGLPLADVRIDYGKQTPDGEMKVVGHMEQMRLSRCYTESNSLTCITCHNPHEPIPPPERVTYYRQVCLDCHTEESCGLPKPRRLEESADDDCVSCHMPKTETDIPHFAFTHHRISKHTDEAEGPADSPDDRHSILKPLADTSHLSQAERDRALGLAYLEFAVKEPAFYQEHVRHAGHLLEKGEPDSECLAGLARVYWEAGLPQAATMAEQALRAKSNSASSRLNALVVRANHRLTQGRFRAAQKDFEKLTQLKRFAEYWALLAETHLRQNQLPEAIDALETAIEIAPDRVDLRMLLMRLFRQAEQQKKADAQEHAIDVLTSPRKSSE